MFHSTRSKLIVSFLGVTLLVGTVSLFIGWRLLDKHVIGEATARVQLNLNATREIYLNRIKSIKLALKIAALGFRFTGSFNHLSAEDPALHLERAAKSAELDFAGLTDSKGETVCRIGSDPIPRKKPQPLNPIAALVLERKAPVAGTLLLSKEFLAGEAPDLADQARIPLETTDNVVPTLGMEETYGMALSVGVPVIHGGEFLGVLYGGILLNRNPAIIDIVKDTVFLNETYKGRSIGRITIFMNDVRISTNVLYQNGDPAIGTRVSSDVKEHVLQKGETWIQRACVLSEWYITSYEPIVDLYGKRIGILGVGVLEEKYVDIRRNTLLLFILVTVAGMLLATGLGYFVSHKITKPIKHLIRASKQVSEGSLTPDIGPMSNDEIGVLQRAFKEMVAAMGRRRASSESKLIQSEKQASIGRLAAGVAHEVNNPLTGVLTYTHMLLRREDISDDVRDDLKTIADATDRVRKIVKDLLDFSRQTEINRESIDINILAKSAISLIEKQALVKGVNIRFDEGTDLPTVTLDRSQFQSVILNILLNALDATEEGGEITISTGVSLSTSEERRRGVEIVIEDTGCGMTPQILDRIFDPFFSTKDEGKGTGLGLSVSLGIVQRHGGTIKVKSEIDKGSAFFIWVPIEGRSSIQ
ncbi:MAG: cache domain-containing protein [Deltaproteobacteria bacterium]|nr:cache domain-containing protein [Deltaproteobacteria bacterium]